MKNILILLSFLTVSFAATAQIDFEHTTLERALRQADREDKLVMVDAYTTWCGPCKWMARNTFSSYRIGDFYNENFVSIKVDMETYSGQKLHNRYYITSYPTILFLDTDGTEIYRVVGAQDIRDFLAIGRGVVNYYN